MRFDVYSLRIPMRILQRFRGKSFMDSERNPSGVSMGISKSFLRESFRDSVANHFGGIL